MLGPNPQAWSGFKACMGGGDIAFPVFALTSGRDRVTHGTNLPDLLTRIQICSSKSLCKCYLSLGKIGATLGIFMPKWCKMVLEWSLACTPRPHLTSFTRLTVCEMCLLGMVGAGNLANV